MRVAVDHAVVRERIPPRLEHRLRDGVAILQRRALVVEQLAAFEPGHGQQALGRQVRQHLRHADPGLVLEDQRVQRRVGRFQLVVELLAQPRRYLFEDVGRFDGGVHARMQREHDLELVEVRLHRRLHVGILQLGCQRAPVVRYGAVHLSERRRRCRLRLEALEARGPFRSEFGHHAPAQESRAHGRGLRLQLGKLLRIFRRQCLGNSGQQLRHLHDRPLEAAQSRGQRRRILWIVAAHAEEALARNAGCHRADVAAHPHVARSPRRKPVFLFVLAVVQGWPS